MKGIQRAVLLAVLLAAVGCSARPASVVVVVIDTLRADHLGAYGYPRPTSPNLDRLASTGYVFDSAIAQSSWTTPSVGSLFTSTYPSVHGAVTFTASLPPSLETLADVFRRRGYQTAGISANFVHVTRAKGFAAGFDSFAELKHAPAAGEEPLLLGNVPANAAEITDAALGWLERRGRGPFFLYLHYMDPHSSYQPPVEYRELFGAAGYAGPVDGSTEQIKRVARGEMPLGPDDRQRLIDLYDGEIAFADEQVGRLFRSLEESGAADDAYVVVLSDHGEEFLDHGRLFHGSTLYRESIRVPLIVRPPGGATDARRIRAVVGLVDVGPTLLALTGEPDARPTQGRSFAWLLEAGATAPWPGLTFSELFEDRIVEARVYPKRHAAALVSERWTYLTLRAGGEELFDAEADPAQLENRAAAEGAAAAEAASALARHAAACEDLSRGVAKAGGELSAEERERLRALGYVQ